MSTRTLLRPLPPPVDTPPEDFDVTVPAPDPWRRRAGRRAAHEWRVRGLRWPGEAADRPPVVLVHGLVVAARMVEPLARRLAVDGPVLAPDLPGCGRSDKPRPVPDVDELGEVIARICRTATARRPVLVGTSLGSQVALAAAVHDPGAVAGVVLASPTVDEQRRSWPSQLLRWQREQGTQGLRMRAIQVLDYRRAGIPRAMRTFAAAMRHRPEHAVRELRVPALVVWGGRDPLIRRTWARRLAGRAPDADLAVLPGAVHAMSHENPLELARVVNGFVDALADRPPDHHEVRQPHDRPSDTADRSEHP